VLSGGTGAWSSSNTGVATVDGTGLVTGVAAGSCNIIYTITGGCGGTVSQQQNVTIQPNASIASVTGSSPLCVGGTTTYTANSAILGGGTGAWSSSNTGIATVDGSGLVTGVAAGSCNIIYTITGGCGGTVSQQQNVIIEPNASVASVTGSSPLCIGGTTTYAANSIVLGGGTGAWSSSNTGIATVDGSGLVTGVAAGSCNIIYTITGGCGGTVSQQQNVTIEPNASIASVTGSSPLCIGGTATYTANSSVLGGGSGAWSSSNTGVATVDGSGLVSGVAAGSCNIIYTISGGCGGTVSQQQNVTIQPNASIASVTGSSPICIGATTNYTANTIVLSGGTGSWSSDNTGIATVDGSGVVTGVAAGSCNIIYTITGGCGGTATAQQSVTITMNADATILSTAQVCISQPAFTLSATDAGGVWSGTGITNTSTGLFDPATAGIGSHQIIYTISGSCGDADTVMLDVVNIVDATITPTAPICISNAPAALTAANPGGVWSGTGITNTTTGLFDPSVAGIGNHDIIYTISGSCGSADTITVSVVSLVDASINAAGPFCLNIPTITLSATTNGGVWTGTGITSAAMGTFDPALAGAGLHDIIYTISGACGNADTIQLTVYAVPSTSTSAVAESCTGKFDGTATVIPSGGASPYSYLWSNSATGATITGLSPDLYTVIVTDANSCSTLDTAIILTSGTACETVVPVIYIPNIFTPNGDGNNDVLYVRGQGITSFTLTIYDRWGEKVFETSDLDKGWDGTLHGKKMDQAVFVWYVHAEFADGTTKDDKGNLTMTR
jgi:gliding motility-associated-like protein